MMLVVLGVTIATVYLAEENRRANYQRALDAALGYRFTNYLQGKLQYSFSQESSQMGGHLVAAQLTVKY